MAVTIRVGIIFLTFITYVHLHKLCSSYFTISYQKHAHQESEKLAQFSADSELACALRCNREDICDKVIFKRNSKKCLLFQTKDQSSPDPYYAGDCSMRSGIVTMRKVPINPLNESTAGCAANVDKHPDDIDDVKVDGGDVDTDDSRQVFPPFKGENIIKGRSCRDILQRNSSSRNGFYNITAGNITWLTWCRMDGIHKCGNGAWTLVMRINGSKKTFSYDSQQWTSKASYQTVFQGHWQETKLPGYFLSPFNRICVKMWFPSDNRRTTIMLNHTAKSLYSIFHERISKTWPADSFGAPLNVDTSCLVQGFNLTAQLPKMTIKSRVGVQSQPDQCGTPYLVGGVGIGYHFGDRLHNLKIPEISCGEIRISSPVLNPNTYAALCRIYVQ